MGQTGIRHFFIALRLLTGGQTDPYEKYGRVNGVIVVWEERKKGNRRGTRKELGGGGDEKVDHDARRRAILPG